MVTVYRCSFRNFDAAELETEFGLLERDNESYKLKVKLSKPDTKDEIHQTVETNENVKTESVKRGRPRRVSAAASSPAIKKSRK